MVQPMVVGREAIGDHRWSLHWLVLDMPLDWEMFGVFHIWFTEMVAVSIKSA